MSKVFRKIREVLSYAPASGVASPKQRVFFDTSCIPLTDVMKLYDRDPTCKSSVDLLAASTVGMGFYTTADEKYEKASEAKAAVDKFCEDVNVDGMLNEMAKPLIGCGNDFWLKLTPEQLTDIVRTPIDAIQRIGLSSVPDLKLPNKVTGYQLKSTYAGSAGNELKPEAVIHWRLSGDVPSGFGVGLLQVLLHTLTLDTDKRPSYAWMKAKIEKILPNIFTKYAGPDVVVQLEGQKEDTIKKYESAIKNRPEEGQWLFSGAKNVGVYPVTIDPRARFEYYIDHMVNQFYLGCETPLPRLFSTPGFTEASARAALDLQDMLIKPVQRYIKRQVEREIFAVVVAQAGLDAVKAKVRLNFGSPETPELVPSDLIKAAELGLVRAEEFRKNAVKFGWELWDAQPEGEVQSKEVNEK
ncbi:hypothetical protein G4O51_03090 [Candidatus Bathyarchaeota archaeon A05DMB-2]|jgi:hypothetical protein|nr:hypothetical protein [Candidatus Bathyarchaeota archaeon A05DMB-2]